MSCKDVDSLVAMLNERRERVSEEIHNKIFEESDIADLSDCDDEDVIEEQSLNHSTFNLTKFMKDHPSATYENMTNFTSEEIDEFVDIIERNIDKQRGKKSRVSKKGQIFLTLMYYSSYVSLKTLSEIVNIKVPTLDRIIKKVTHLYFPVFIRKFIPKSIPTCRIQFKNFPSAIGAVDSSTIPFYRPSDTQKKKAS